LKPALWGTYATRQGSSQHWKKAAALVGEKLCKLRISLLAALLEMRHRADI
jgi:hypothetical protein